MEKLTAVLLCGGKGGRLRPFTDSLPKPLVPLNGRPLLYHLMNYLHKVGIKKFVLCTGYKADSIEEFVQNHGESGWNVTCVNSGDVSMTDRIIDAREHISGQAVICYGDTIANVDIAALKVFHEQNEALATLTTYTLHSPFGIVNSDASGKISRFEEKPVLPYWINIGFMLCEREMFEFLPKGSTMVDLLTELADAGRLFSYRHSGKHLTVNTEKERALAENEIISCYTDVEGCIT